MVFLVSCLNSPIQFGVNLLQKEMEKVAVFPVLDNIMVFDTRYSQLSIIANSVIAQNSIIAHQSVNRIYIYIA